LAPHQRHNFHVHAPQKTAHPTASMAMLIVAVVGPKRSDSTPATMYETAMVSVTKP
jgi:hypothetical protein